MSTTIDESGCLQPRHGRFKWLRRLQLTLCLVSVLLIAAALFVGPIAVHGQDASDAAVGEPVGIGAGTGLYFDYWPSRNTRYLSHDGQGVLGAGGWSEAKPFVGLGEVPLTVIQFDWADGPMEFTRGSLDREALVSLQEDGAIEIVDEWEISTAADGSFSMTEREPLQPGMYLLLPDWGSHALESMQELTIRLPSREIVHSIDDGDELSIIFQGGW